MHRSSGSKWIFFALACLIAVASTGAPADGKNGGSKGDGGGGHHGGSQKGDGGGNDSSGRDPSAKGGAAGAKHGKGREAKSHHGKGHDSGSRHGKGHRGGLHKGLSADPNGSPVDDPTSSVATTGSIVASTGARQLPDLPLTLQPVDESNSLPTVSPVAAPPAGVPDDVIRACRVAIESAAATFSATSVRVSSAGSVHQLSRDMLSAPIRVSIDYARQGGVETRQAQISCQLNATGDVIGLT